LDERRLVDQERRERVREAGGGRRVGRDRGLLRPELKLTTRSAVVLRLQEEVARIAEVFAELDRMVAGDFGGDGGELDGSLGAIPRQASGEADQRAAQAEACAEVARGHPARPVVDVRAGDTDLLGGLEAGAAGQRLVVEIVQA